jgi:peptide/nickel transport system permease protein
MAIEQMEQPVAIPQAGAGRSGRPTGLRRIRRMIRRWPLGAFGAVLMILFLFLGIFAPFVAPNDPRDFAGGRLESPNAEFWFGTNNLGQDIYSRTIFGAQISLAIGFSSVLFGISVGTFLGLMGGYFGGKIDLVIQRAVEIIAAFPGLVLALVVIAALGRPDSRATDVFNQTWEMRTLIIAIGLAFVFATTRIIRSVVLSERERAYVEAAYSMGATPFRVVGRHLLPNTFPYIIVSGTIVIGIAILLEAALSFLGYGVSPGTPSWGMDLSGRNRDYFIDAPWMAIAPGVALSLTVLGINLLGDALRDGLDPRMRGSR